MYHDVKEHMQAIKDAYRCYGEPQRAEMLEQTVDAFVSIWQTVKARAIILRFYDDIEPSKLEPVRERLKDECKLEINVYGLPFQGQADVVLLPLEYAEDDFRRKGLETIYDVDKDALVLGVAKHVNDTGLLLRSLMSLHKMQTRELAQILGVNDSMVSNLRKGAHISPLRAKMLAAIFSEVTAREWLIMQLSRDLYKADTAKVARIRKAARKHFRNAAIQMEKCRTRANKPIPFSELPNSARERLSFYKTHCELLQETHKHGSVVGCLKIRNGHKIAIFDSDDLRIEAGYSLIDYDA